MIARTVVQRNPLGIEMNVESSQNWLTVRLSVAMSRHPQKNFVRFVESKNNFERTECGTKKNLVRNKFQSQQHQSTNPVDCSGICSTIPNKWRSQLIVVKFLTQFPKSRFSNNWCESHIRNFRILITIV